MFLNVTSLANGVVIENYGPDNFVNTTMNIDKIVGFATYKVKGKEPLTRVILDGDRDVYLKESYKDILDVLRHHSLILDLPNPKTDKELTAAITSFDRSKLGI